MALENSVGSNLRLAAGRVILDRVGLAKLWGANGPTRAAFESLSTIEEAPAIERIVTLAAWAIWDGSGDLKLAEILALGDRATATLVAGYLVAATYGDQIVSDWLATTRKDDAAEE